MAQLKGYSVERRRRGLCDVTLKHLNCSPLLQRISDPWCQLLILHMHRVHWSLITRHQHLVTRRLRGLSSHNLLIHPGVDVIKNKTRIARDSSVKIFSEASSGRNQMYMNGFLMIRVFVFPYTWRAQCVMTPDVIPRGLATNITSDVSSVSRPGATEELTAHSSHTLPILLQWHEWAQLRFERYPSVNKLFWNLCRTCFYQFKSPASC